MVNGGVGALVISSSIKLDLRSCLHGLTPRGVCLFAEVLAKNINNMVGDKI